MKWFGEHWGAPICNQCEHVETPTGLACLHCHEKISATDNGFIYPHITLSGVSEAAWHYECHMRSIIGGVYHQLGTCSCFVPGVKTEEPPELTKRQAARLAVDLWEQQNHIGRRCD